MKSEAYLQALAQRIASQIKFLESSLLCGDIFGKIYKKNAQSLVFGESKNLEITDECRKFKEFLKRNGEDDALSDDEICHVANSVIKIKLTRAA